MQQESDQRTCGGTNKGKCEVSSEMDCAWYLIYERLKARGGLDELRKMRPARDWRKDRGPAYGA